MSFEEKTIEFNNWMRAAGIEVTHAELADYRAQGQGRGLVATQAIAAGDRIVSIPPAALITAASVPELQELIQELEEWPQLILTMLYLAEKEWKPYFGVLPTSFGTPMFWSEEELERLRPSALLDKIGREEAEEMYRELEPVLAAPLFKGLDTSPAAFHRMGSLIMAYGFDVVQGEETIKAMVPPADMLNSHSQLWNARLEMPEEDGGRLEVVATKDIAAGEQIYNFYGEQPNSDLLRRYGYVEAGGNPSDVVEVSLGLLLAAAQLEESALAKWEKYDEAEIIEEAFDIGDQGIPDPDLIAMANLLSEPQPAKKKYQKCIEMAEEQELTPSARRILQGAVASRLEEYAGVEVELPEAVNDVYTEQRAMCRQVLATEKHLLEMCLGWLDDGTKRARVA